MTIGSSSAVNADKRVPVAETFYSFQGEGVNLGRRALFLRFSGCNLTCGYPSLPRDAATDATGAMVCDTEYTWNTARHDLSTARRLTSGEVWAELIALDPATNDSSLPVVDLIVVSGGEPMMRQKVIIDVARRAHPDGRQVEIETNATIPPRPELIETGVFFNAGLKLASSAVPRARRIKPAAIVALQSTGRTRWKFVITGPDDLEEVSALQAEFGLTEVWLSPEGTTPGLVVDHMRIVAEEALRRGWHLTTRQHVLIWSDERGR
ncbi:7-carboxy-7-deazaguanine synthase QueE [Actinoplanes sp. NPDC051411]|uniref:7-carboxy-7-deazaguanine synthase QueE n=1 Tax=Actinoplanes sp. NPDC051411 TaxID=3155522 RepID=UPI0034479B49